MSKKISVLQVAILVCIIVFSLLSIPTSFDLSVLAVFIGLGSAFFCYYIGFRVFLQKKDAKLLPIIRKMYEYLPFVLLFAFVLRRAGQFGTPYALDFITVIFWVAVTVFSNVLLFLLSEKRVYLQNSDLELSRLDIPPKKKNPIRKVVLELFSWIDAFVQAALIVLLVNIFIFQLYEIPSESMVPEFLIKDRVVVFKTPSGPRFPLSDVGLPTFRSYERGDIVVFRNPHYETTRKSEIKNFISQIVFMLTFTKVNLNVDEYGEMKADPLVKRVCGESGEQLVMVDGVLYARTKESSIFTPVKDDALWAEWNVNGLSVSQKEKIRTIPLSGELYSTLLSVEKERRDFDISEAEKEATDLVQEFNRLKSNVVVSSDTALSSDISSFLSVQEMNEFFIFSQNLSITRKLLTSSGGEQWFNEFMTSWTSSIPESMDLYNESIFKLNLMSKLVIGKLIIRNTELMLNGTSSSLISEDRIIENLLAKAESLHIYIALNDSRNMSVFPPNAQNGQPQYLSKNSYFLMGDNRFNSLDMRHTYDSLYIPLTPYDSYSLYYSSNLEPREVNAKRILGTSVFRFWPLSRIGVPGLTAEKSQ